MENEELFKRFEAYLSDNLFSYRSFHPHFERAYKEMFEAGGKRFRPLLLLNVVDSYEPLLVESALPVAMALEMLHTYSLIHDDLPTFDDAALRRGKETLHVKYDEVTATLVGDALNSDSFLVIANAPLADDVKIELIRCFGENSGGGGMVLGQAIDCFFEKKKLALDELKFLHIHKTAKLIAASLKMGGIIVNLPKVKLFKLYDIGLKIGLLFQVQDDIIDATKSESEVGKPTSNDTFKNSFVNLLGIDEAIKKRAELKDELLNEIKELDSRLQARLTQIIMKYFK